MLITRVTSPSIPLVDAATLSEWLRIDAGTDTATVAMLLASAVDYIEGLTGRVLLAADYTLDFDSICPVQSIPIAPINSIASVSATLSDGTSQTLDPTAYVARLASTIPTISFVSLPDTTIGVTVECNAGYVTTEAVPASLQHAAAVLVGAGYDSRQSLDPATIATVANLVARYRRVFVA